MSKRLWIILGIIAAVLVGFLLLRGGDEAGAPSGGDQPEGSQNISGPADADVVLVEYGDFQCSGCARYWPAIDQVKEKYAESITFQYRHLPLPIHQNARAAARAAEAAGMQGKFWEMHDLLFLHQQSWAEVGNVAAIFEGYAEQLELDIDKYKEDFGSSRVNRLINQDIELFNATGRQMATPTFFLNGEVISPEPALESFSELIDEALQEANSQ